jgi:hypothetical protein
VVSAEIDRSISGAISAQVRGGPAPTITELVLGPLIRQASSMKCAPVVVV